MAVKIKPHFFHSCYLFDYIPKDLNKKYAWADWPLINKVPFGTRDGGSIKRFNSNIEEIREHFNEDLGVPEDAEITKNYIEISLSEFPKFRQLFHCMTKGIKIETTCEVNVKASSDGAHESSVSSERGECGVPFMGGCEKRNCCDKRPPCCCPPISIKDSQTEGSGNNRKLIITCENKYSSYDCNRSHSYKANGSILVDTSQVYTKYEKDTNGNLSSLNEFTREVIGNQDDDSKKTDTLKVVSDFLYEKQWQFKKVQKRLGQRSIRVPVWTNIPDPIITLYYKQEYDSGSPLPAIKETINVSIREESSRFDEEKNTPKEETFTAESSEFTKLKISQEYKKITGSNTDDFKLKMNIYRIVYLKNEKKFLVFFDFEAITPTIPDSYFLRYTTKDGEDGYATRGISTEGVEFIRDYKYAISDDKFASKDKIDLEKFKIKVNFSSDNNKNFKEFECFRYSKKSGSPEKPENDESCWEFQNEEVSASINIKNIEIMGWGKNDFDASYKYPKFK